MVVMSLDSLSKKAIHGAGTEVTVLLPAWSDQRKMRRIESLRGVGNLRQWALSHIEARVTGIWDGSLGIPGLALRPSLF